LSFACQREALIHHDRAASINEIQEYEMIMTREEQLTFSTHDCEKSGTIVVEFNDCGIRIPSIPQLPSNMRVCPFCGHNCLDMMRVRFEKRCETLAVAMPEEIAPVVADMVLRLERPEFPENGIVNHFGPYANINGLSVHLTNKDARLQATLYQDRVGRPAALHRARADAVARALTTSVLDTWHGVDGQCGISVVFRRNAPEGLVIALANYRKMKNVFCPSQADKAGYTAFEAWYQADTEVEKKETT
jgi:hypothetical protein